MQTKIVGIIGVMIAAMSMIFGVAYNLHNMQIGVLESQISLLRADRDTLRLKLYPETHLKLLSQKELSSVKMKRLEIEKSINENLEHLRTASSIEGSSIGTRYLNDSEIRIILKWGQELKDLDAHLVFGKEHINFARHSGRGASLDVDDTNGYGPEVITIQHRINGLKYDYFVEASPDVDPRSDALSKSRAKVYLYSVESLDPLVFEIPKGMLGNKWAVFSIDGNGLIKATNRVVSNRIASKGVTR